MPATCVKFQIITSKRRKRLHINPIPAQKMSKIHKLQKLAFVTMVTLLAKANFVLTVSYYLVHMKICFQKKRQLACNLINNMVCRISLLQTSFASKFEVKKISFNKCYYRPIHCCIFIRIGDYICLFASISSSLSCCAIPYLT